MPPNTPSAHNQALMLQYKKEMLNEILKKREASRKILNLMKAIRILEDK